MLVRFRTMFVASAAFAALVLGVGTPASASCEELLITPVGSYYLDVRSTEPLDIWIYEESNGMAGLQRGDDIDAECITFDAEGNPITPDTLIF